MEDRMFALSPNVGMYETTLTGTPTVTKNADGTLTITSADLEHEPVLEVTRLTTHNLVVVSTANDVFVMTADEFDRQF